jgi:sortase (surface protein transpeptidase)
VRLVAALAIGAAAAATVTLAHLSQPAPVAAAATPPVPSWSIEPPTSGQSMAAPVRVRIPAIGVDGPIVGIGVDAAGALTPPADTSQVGWYAQGPAPGDVGPAILAGHVDSRAGPGVFFRLRQLRAGDQVQVARADGSAQNFTVVSITQVAKADFPTDQVYAPAPAPILRLVTCGGSFDRAARSYLDNLIVDAVAA